MAQRLDSYGNRQWPPLGLAVSMAPGDQIEAALIPDNHNGLFITWADSRGVQGQMSGTHLDEDGNPTGDPYWRTDGGGALIGPSGRVWGPEAVAPDGPNGFVAFWADARSSRIEPLHDIYAQRIAEGVSSDEQPTALPKAYALQQNYPNPFNPATEIAFALPKAGLVTLKIYDLLGRQVTTLVNRSMQAGDHRISFDASSLASGIYFYRLESGGFSATRKMVLLK
jgi:hypothetical protein